MGTYPRHVLYFSRKIYLRLFDLFPKNQNFDPSCFDPIQKFGMSTRGLTLIFDPVPSTYFRPPAPHSIFAFKKSVFADVDNCLAHFAEFRCPLCRISMPVLPKKIGKMGKVWLGGFAFLDKWQPRGLAIWHVASLLHCLCN